jgi:hypothetical protein
LVGLGRQSRARFDLEACALFVGDGYVIVGKMADALAILSS